MSLPKQTISWPIDGGLDTKTSPLSIQPGSFLQLDNVVQERKGEWRRRNGFTQVAADTTTCPALVSTLGDTGMVAASEVTGWSAYRPSLTSGRWSAASSTYAPVTYARTPIAESDSTAVGFAAGGSMYLVAHLGTAPRLLVFDRVGGVTVSTTSLAGLGYLSVRGAATTTHGVMVMADSSGNLRTYVCDLATGAITGPTTIKTGLHTTGPYLDVLWYGGSTVTIVCRTSGDAVRYIEFNPATGALATDTTLSAVSCGSCLSLMHDPDASGTRIVGTSHSTPTTRVIRCDSAGTISTNDQVEAVASLHITGVASNAGADWSVVYRTTTPNLRSNTKLAGVVGSPAALQGVTTWSDNGFIDTQAWREPGSTDMRYVVGLHYQGGEDPQDTWVEVKAPIATPGTFDPQSPIVPQQACSQLTLAPRSFQVVRTGTRTFAMALPVLSFYSNASGIISRRYSVDIFEQTQLASANIASVNIGSPVAYKQGAYFPGGALSFPDEGVMRQVGTYHPPRVPVLTPSSGGSMTLLATYGYVALVESFDADGNIWRAPRSAAALVTLTGGQNRVTVTFPSWAVEARGRYFRYALYRTSANGSSYKLIYSSYFVPGTDVVYVDDASDATIINGQILYTTGELTTAITPPASHVALFNDRLWLVNRDFRTELWASKNLRPGRQPEFTFENTVDIDDAAGDITGIANLDDKGVVFKKSAIYFVMGDGYTDSGSGSPFTYVQIKNDIGAIPGSPIVVAGDAVYFVSERGIYSVDKQGQVIFVGAAVDQYLNQPLIQTKETVYDGCFVPAANEVRFVTTNYVLVFSRTFGTWTRWTGLSGMKRCLVVNGRMVLFKTDGTVWREGDHTQLTDQGTAFTGVIRSPWIRPAAGQAGLNNASTTTQQGMRVYRGRVIYTRTSGGGSVSLIGKIYRNNDDTLVETFTSGALDGSVLSELGQMDPYNQKCTSFSVGLTLPSGDVTVRLDGFSADVGLRNGGSMRVANSKRWA